VVVPVASICRTIGSTCATKPSALQIDQRLLI
jgi:hypothetical protein